MPGHLRAKVKEARLRVAPKIRRGEKQAGRFKAQSHREIDGRCWIVGLERGFACAAVAVRCPPGRRAAQDTQLRYVACLVGCLACAPHRCTTPPVAPRSSASNTHILALAWLDPYMYSRRPKLGGDIEFEIHKVQIPLKPRSSSSSSAGWGETPASVYMTQAGALKTHFGPRSRPLGPHRPKSARRPAVAGPRPPPR